MVTRRLVAVACALAALQLSATTYTWTGASANNQDGVGKWTDSGNWSEDGTPGAADIAVFPSVADGAATTIDLDGAEPVGGIVVRGADAPSYAFGTSADQILRLASYDNGNSWLNSQDLAKVTVEAEVVRSQTIVAGFAVGCDLAWAEKSTYGYAGIANLSPSATVTIGNFGYVSAVNESTETLKTAPRGYFSVMGPGLVVVNGEPKAGNVGLGQNYMCFSDYANVSFRKSFTMYGRFDMAGGHTGKAYRRNVEICEGVTLYQYNGNFSSLNGGHDHRWYGAGRLQVDGQAFLEIATGGEGADRIYDVCVTTTASENSSQRRSVGIYSTPNGTFHFNNPTNGFHGRLWIFYGNSSALGLVVYGSKLGRKDEVSSFGSVSNFVCSSGAGVGFSGSEPDTTDRELVFGDLTCYGVAAGNYHWSGATELRVCADGTAPFTVDSEVWHEYTDAKGTNVIRLAGAGTGGGIWRKPLVDATTCYSAGSSYSRPLGTPVTVGVTKSGTGTWTLAGANTYTGDTTVEEGTLVLGADGSVAPASRVVMAGGTLAVAGGAAKAIGTLTAKAGDSRLMLGTGATLTVSAIETPTAGTIDIETEDGAAFVCPALAGQDAPAWLTMKGIGARFDADGKAHASTVLGVTDLIPARGGVIPNKADAIVGIASPGETAAGPITLAATPTAISDLVMREPTVPATVDLAGGQFAAQALHLDPEAASLTVGTGTGSVAAPRGTLTLDAYGTELLSVASPLDASVTTVAKTGTGTAKVAGTTAFAGSLVVSNGTLAVADGFTFDPQKLTLAGTSQHGTADAPTLTICDGAAIEFGESLVKSADNLFNVGGIPQTGSTDDAFRPGRLVVTNASLKVPASVADSDVKRFFKIGRGSAGELLVEEGADVSGTFIVGMDYGRGIIRQNGGTLTAVGKNWAGTTFVGNATAYGAYMMNGGTATFNNVTIFGYGSGYKAMGLLEQRGGTMNFATLQIGFAKMGYGAGHVTGGTLNASTLAIPRNTSDTMNESGAFCVERAGVAKVTGFVTLGSGTNNASGIVVLGDGGRLTTSSKFRICTDASSLLPTWNSATLYGEVAFNGGTLVLDGSENRPFDVSPTEKNPCMRTIDRVSVFAGGATVEVPAGKSRQLTLPFERPAGRGVKSVPWDESMARDAFAPPCVEITGDGRGAVAFADWDEENRRVKGIRVVSPGSGYTTATALVFYGMLKGSASKQDSVEVACELTDDGVAQMSGDFVKAGDGDLTFEVANTYGGDTVLKGGTLTAAVADAIPSGSHVVLAGGTLALGSGVSTPAFALDALGSFESDGTFAFPEGSQIEVRNLDRVTDQTIPHWIVQYKGGVTGNPVIVNTCDIPKDWKIRRSSTGFKLTKQTGTLLLVR